MKIPKFICVTLLSVVPFSVVVTAQNTDGVIKQAYEAYRSKNYEKSSQLWSEAIKQGVKDPNLIYDAACAFALAGKKTRHSRILRSR